MPCCLAISRGLRQLELPADTRRKGTDGRERPRGKGVPRIRGNMERGVKRDVGFMPRTRGMRNEEAHASTREKENEEGRRRGTATGGERSNEIEGGNEGGGGNGLPRRTTGKRGGERPSECNFAPRFCTAGMNIPMNLPFSPIANRGVSSLARKTRGRRSRSRASWIGHWGFAFRLPHRSRFPSGPIDFDGPRITTGRRIYIGRAGEPRTGARGDRRDASVDRIK